MTALGKGLFAVAAILLFWALALGSLVGDSPTMDEQNHVARGLAYLRTGDPRFSLEHPPLVNTLSALPLLTMPGLQLPLDHPSWEHPQGWYEFAELLFWEYNQDVTRMIFLARLPIVYLTLGLALAAYQFASSLWGPSSGLFAFFFLLFDPNVLAHGRYATTDLGGSLFVLLAAVALWRLWRAPRWDATRLLAAALALGLAFSSKLSALAFGPIFGVMAVLPLYGAPQGRRGALRRLLQLGVAGAGALIVVWAIFGFQWGPLRFQSALLAPLAGNPGPMPTFWAGIEQIAFLSGGGRPSFLLGRTSTEGFAAYFPVAFLVKTPLPTLILLAISPMMLVHRRATAPERRKGLFLLLPPLLYFALSLSSELNIGYRHLLPMLPFLYILAAGTAVKLLRPAPGSPLLTLLRRAGSYALAGALLLSTLLITPHYLSYFNLIGGGPANGYRILVDSNVDWGQDLLRLRRWMTDQEVEHLNLSWFGTADPVYYGIEYRPLPGLPRHFDLWWDVPFDAADPEPGIYAISVSNFWELPLQEDKHVFRWFRERPPDDRVGYSILIYEVN